MGVEAEVENKRHRRSSQEITALIEEYRQSGQTRREFCQSHGLALSSFQSSIRRRRRRQRSAKTEPDPIREVKIVGKCGKPTVVIGYETAEQLDRAPAKYFVRVLKREKRACSSCVQGGVQTAALAARIIEKSIVSDQVIIDTVVAKYCDYVPLYRQSAILEREVGLEISRTTMCDWVMQVGEQRGLLPPFWKQG